MYARQKLWSWEMNSFTKLHNKSEDISGSNVHQKGGKLARFFFSSLMTGVSIKAVTFPVFPVLSWSQHSLSRFPTVSFTSPLCTPPSLLLLLPLLLPALPSSLFHSISLSFSHPHFSWLIPFPSRVFLLPSSSQPLRWSQLVARPADATLLVRSRSSLSPSLSLSSSPTSAALVLT